MKIGRERIVLLLIAVVLSSAAVSVAGAIGFIGLLGPHIAKSIVGPRHQMFLPFPYLLVPFTCVGRHCRTSDITAFWYASWYCCINHRRTLFLYLMYKTKSV